MSNFVSYIAVMVTSTKKTTLSALGATSMVVIGAKPLQIHDSNIHEVICSCTCLPYSFFQHSWNVNYTQVISSHQDVMERHLPRRIWIQHQRPLRSLAYKNCRTRAILQITTIHTTDHATSLDSIQLGGIFLFIANATSVTLPTLIYPIRAPHLCSLSKISGLFTLKFLWLSTYLVCFRSYLFAVSTLLQILCDFDNLWLDEKTRCICACKSAS